MKGYFCILIALAGAGASGRAQGFANLDFENPILPLVPVNFQVPTTNAMPGWTAYVGGIQGSQVVYNTRPLDAAEVTFQGTNSDSLAPIQGNYTVELFGASMFAPQQSAAIGQTGQIPLNARSLVFWGYSTDVSFGGQALSLIVIGSTPNYNIYAADISAYAGETGQLLFTAQPQSLDIIDNIQFSSSPVPEPSVLVFCTAGMALIGLCRWRVSKR